jgi:hypothetical protein
MAHDSADRGIKGSRYGLGSGGCQPLAVAGVEELASGKGGVKGGWCQLQGLSWHRSYRYPFRRPDISFHILNRSFHAFGLTQSFF